MSHMKLHHVVNVDVRSTDTQLLDALEADMPADDAPYVGPEYDGPRRLTDADDPDLADGEERLTGRVAFVVGSVDVENDDGSTTTTYDGAEEATDLYAALTDHDLTGAGAYTVRHYQSPVGAVTTDDVQAWYREDETRQPADDDGVPFVPTSFDPSRHVVAEESGN